MKELVEFITKALVNDPDAVSVTVVQKGNMEVYQIHVAPQDMGKVIGHHGKIAKQIRILMRSVAQKQGKRVSVDIMD